MVILNSVVFIVMNGKARTVLGFNAINDEIISVRFCGQPFNIIIHISAPTNHAEDVDEFYSLKLI